MYMATLLCLKSEFFSFNGNKSKDNIHSVQKKFFKKLNSCLFNRTVLGLFFDKLIMY